jgi:hypothetical protein
MKRALSFALLLAAAWTSVGCHRRKNPAPQAAETGSRFAANVHMGDPKSASQLLGGFYDIENGGWRWTGKQFTVELGPPYGAAQRGATLELSLSVPPVVIEKSRTVTLGASVDGNALPEETYSQPGDYVYRRDVPAALLQGESVKVTFTLDRTIQAAGGDTRDLGVVAVSAGLKGK